MASNYWYKIDRKLGGYFVALIFLWTSFIGTLICNGTAKLISIQSNPSVHKKLERLALKTDPNLMLRSIAEKTQKMLGWNHDAKLMYQKCVNRACAMSRQNLRLALIFHLVLWCLFSVWYLFWNLLAHKTTLHCIGFSFCWIHCLLPSTLIETEQK